MRRSSNSPAASSTSRLAPTGRLHAVGLDRDVAAITERLCEEANELRILPIVGTGGIGKTTLARNVYHDPLIIGNFEIRAWVIVSQDYSFGDIFSSLLVSMKDFVKDDISGLNNQKMAEKMYQTLRGRRYLIVIDDMWSTKSWDEVIIYFPDNSNGSRIILTTRLEDVAAYADSLKRFHEMQFLNVDQSWDILQKQVFKGESPPTLKKIGRKIAESCRGLPLAIVVIAGLLSEVGQTEEDWKQIANNINLAITADVEEYSAILSLSYDHLPHQLRQCFLYMGAFPEDYEIRVSKLIKLWIAEGFVEWTTSKTPEEAAEGLLEDLVMRNLVLVTKRKSNGRIKSCGLHALLRDLCHIKSLEENFLMCFMDSLFLPEIFETQLRISISHSNILAHIDGSTIRTIICYDDFSLDSFEKFSLLRVLDMLNTYVPAHVFEVRDIRFLAFSYSTIMNIPASISSLQNLQTLIIYPNDLYTINLPVEIWKMSQLRHLISSSFHALPHPEAAALPLENLQTLSMPTNFVCSERMVEMIPNVKKLGICYSGEEFEEDYHLENLEHLDHLEKLKLEMRSDFPFGPNLNPVFPKSLRKLTLSGWRRPWEDLSIIGSLPNLQVLKLRSYACVGSNWETIEETFENLEFLLIDESNLEQWEIESSHFPKLKCLMLHRCLCLSEIPDDIGYIPTLELIEVKGCYQSLVDSAKKIQTDQQMEENYSIQIRYSNALSSSTGHQCTPAMVYEALDSLLHTLTQILKCDDDLTTRRVKRDIISIHDKVVVLQLNLKAFPEKETIRKVASTTHVIIEYLFSPENLSDCGSIEPSVRVSNQLRELAEELDSVVGDVVDYCKINDVRQLSDYPSLSTSIIYPAAITLSHRLGRFAEKILSSPRDLADYSNSTAPTSKDVVGIDEDLSYYAPDAVSSSSSKYGVVGFEEDLTQIMDRLISDSPKLEVLPIVGMGGIGKTTLAKIVYEHTLTMHHFDIRAWITISQDYSVEITCFNLLASMKGKGIKTQSDSYQDEEIYKHLWGRRYLIVLDDIWSRKVWDDMRMLFPNNDCGSRIILTTRLWDVASYTAYFSHIHEVRFLDDRQSWQLFQRKLFADQTCPLEIQSVGKKIVRSCGGLPLSIVTVAELLSGIGTTPKFWEQIVATDGDGQLESILSVSCNHLPHHLKDCFLYMAGFPEDYEIRVSELIKLWVVEGFLEEHPYESNSLEEEAEASLEDLVKRSLVLVTSRKIDGKIKSCRLHNLVRDICVRQAGQKKLLLPVKDCLPSPILRRQFLPQLLKNHHRISASWYDLDLKDSKHCSYTHSIICIPQKGYRPKGSVQNFSSLRVLHVLRRDDHSYWELGQVFDLIHLTYLASNIPSSIVPPAISKLQNLQTLIIYRYEVRLPVEIWRMRQLRHLIAFSFDPLPHPEAATLPLENLQTLSLATDFICRDEMVEMIPNIEKFGICYSGEKFDEGYHLDNLTHLLQLEKLKLEMRSGAFWPSLNRPVFPVSLKKLTLSGCRLPWRDMAAVVGPLPNLEVLKLRNHACSGEHWETTEGEFDALRLLLIDESNLQHWTTYSFHFPLLKCLMLHRCPYLSEIPSDIAQISTLELIEVDSLNQSLLHSAKMIQEKQKEYYGIRSLQVRLKRF